MAYKRKFKKGEKITSLDELASQKWIYVFDKITHNGWFMSWQFRMAQSFLQRGNLYYALPNDDMRKEDEGGMKITKCTGEGQGSCKRCLDNGKWNRMWMCFLYKIEGYDGCYCADCVKELQELQNNSTEKGGD